MSDLNISKCRSCGAKIIWATTERGKRMPLDAVADTRIVLEHRDGQPPLARVVATYVSHFTTCPNAAEHRKKR